MELIFATANSNKFKEAAEILGKGVTLIMPKKLGFQGDIPETGATIEANSQQKCRFIWNKFHKTCFADDTALEVDALGGAPGVYSARYAGEGKDGAANRKKLLEELAAKEDKRKKNSRSARFRTVVTLIHKGTMFTFEGKVEGSIAERECGGGGFGYDALFIPEGCSCCMAEMSDTQKNNISHRGIAMRKLAAFLQTLSD